MGYGDWNSLIQQAKTPQWLREAKFGIYTHWGIYSVHATGYGGPTENTTWYSNALYSQNEAIMKVHREKFGPLEKFGYTDFIPQFTAEKFDPEEWADLFYRAGARFAGPVGEHHDGFSMWKTEHNRCNSWNMGPKRDILKELEKAYRARGMKYMVAMHHAENRWFMPRVPGTDSMKPEFESMFDKKDVWSNEKFFDIWLAKLKEIIDRFSPDMMWFDFGLKEVPDAYKREFFRYYLEHAKKQEQEVIVTYKFHDMLCNTGIIDLELGSFSDMQYQEWITDSTIDETGSWGYCEKASYKSPQELIHYLIDNVSKNGYLLLNVGPKADGTIPEEAKAILRTIGKWLEVNGDAIYGTHGWYRYGEGPTKMEKSGGFSEGEKLRYTGEDIRYTAKGNSLYAILMAWPGREVILHEAAKHLMPGEIETIRMLGTEKPLRWKQEKKDLVIELPETKPCDYAYVLQIRRKPLFEENR